MKKHIVKAVQGLCYASGLSSRLAKRVSVGRVIMLHGVGDEDHPSHVFDKQLAYLSKHFKVITLNRLIEMTNNNEPFTNEIVLTFDDGLKNNLVHAYPILKKYGATATFFVCPGLIERGHWLWNHEMRGRLSSMPANQLTALANEFGCAAKTEAVVTWMKELDVETREQREEHIRQLTPNFTPTEAQKNAYDLMSWDDLRSIDPKVVTVGSHTTNHVIAKDLSQSDLSLEIVDSKSLLESALNYSVEHFCYPNGDYDDATVSAVKSTFQSAVTTKEGFVGALENNYLFNRIPVAPELDYFAWRLHRPTS